MITGLFKKVFGSRNERLLKQYRRIVRTINALEPQTAALSDEQLRAKTIEFRERISKAVAGGEAKTGPEDAQSGQSTALDGRRRAALDAILPEAFAVVREAGKRALGMRHFDVQMVGGIVLHRGEIAEMKTGEGKTLVATLATYLNALEGKGVRTALITNRGLQDLLTIGRQARGRLYDLQPTPLPPPVPAELCLETGGRLDPCGHVVEEPIDADLALLNRQITELAPTAVAINLLYSYVDDRFERRIEAAMPAGMFVARSSFVLPEYKEYERGIAT